MRQTAYRKACAVIVLTLVLCLAAGCATGESQPVVTSDDLTPFSTVARSEDGTGGGQVQPAVSVPEEKDYAYIWPAEDMEASAVKLRGQLVDEYEAADAEGFENQMDVAKRIEERIAYMRTYWEGQRSLDPVVSPQEAANRAGQIFETLYGIDLTEKTLRMSCQARTTAGGGDSSGLCRAVWQVHVGNELDDGSTIEPPAGSYDQIECNLNAVTGEVLNVRWLVSNEECTEIMKTPMADCFIPIKEPSGWMRGGWDETHPEFVPTMQAMMDAFTPLLSGSILTNGAAVTSVEYQLVNRDIPGETVNRLNFFITCENGKTYLMQRNEAIQPYLSYPFDGYPLRAYRFFDMACLQA